MAKEVQPNGTAMFDKLTQKTKALAGSPYADAILALISTVESSVFPLPTEVLFVPMCLARPDRALRYGVIAAVFSVLGGILGWMIGYYFFDMIALPILQYYDGVQKFEELKAATGNGAILVMLITSALAHVPPMKVVTILSGVVGFPLPLFIAAAVVARGAKFVGLGWALKTWGPAIAELIQRRLATFALLAIVTGAGLWLALHFL